MSSRRFFSSTGSLQLKNNDFLVSGFLVGAFIAQKMIITWLSSLKMDGSGRVPRLSVASIGVTDSYTALYAAC